MLNKFVKVAALVAMLTLVVPATNTEAATPKLSTKKITLVVGQSKKLTVKKTSKNVKWRVKKKKVASVKKLNKKSARVTAKKKGKTTVTAIVGGKKLVCRVVVKAKSSSKGSSAKSSGSGSATITETESNNSSSASSESSSSSSAGSGSSSETTTTEKAEVPTEGFFVVTAREDYPALVDGDSISVTISGESLENGYIDSITGTGGYSIGVAGITVEDLSFEVTNNKTESGKPAFVVSLINGDITGGSDYFFVGITGLRAGSADLTLNAGEETATFHITIEGQYSTFMNYNDVLQTMMDTPLGETAELTLEGDFTATNTATINGVVTTFTNEKTITVDGVKGNSDVETLLNLGAWIVDHKDFQSAEEIKAGDYTVSCYFFYRDWWLGSDCAGNNTILEDAATLLGYTAWQGMEDGYGHLYTVAIIDGQKWTFDAGGDGTAGVRGFSGGSTTNDSVNDYAGPSVGYVYNGTMPNRKWTIYYDIYDGTNLTSVATETVTSLADLIRPLPWYGD